MSDTRCQTQEFVWGVRQQESVGASPGLVGNTWAAHCRLQVQSLAQCPTRCRSRCEPRIQFSSPHGGQQVRAMSDFRWFFGYVPTSAIWTEVKRSTCGFFYHRCLYLDSWILENFEKLPTKLFAILILVKKSDIFCLTTVWHVRHDPEILSDTVFRCSRCQILVCMCHGCN